MSNVYRVGETQERLTALLSRGRLQQQPCQGHCLGEPEKDKIVLSLGRVNSIPILQATLSVHFVYFGLHIIIFPL